MNVLLVSGSDLKGGAGRIAYSLGLELREGGHEVRMLAGEKHGDDGWITQLPAPDPDREPDRKDEWLHRAGLNALHLQSSFPRSLSADELKNVDVIHLHDPPRFNLSSLPGLAKRVPVVWTLHTMAPFTGNCLYSLGCERYRKGCGECPLKDEFPLHHLHRDSSAGVIRLKQWFHSRSTIYPVGVSRWVTDRARESATMGRHHLSTIRNGIDVDEFPIQNTAACKSALGIPPSARTILLSVSPNLADRRKGIDIALKALESFGRENVLLIPLGITEGCEELEASLRNLPVASMPPRHLTSRAELAQHYGAADLVWHPSRADTSSLVSMEAMSCGTPVIATDIGGVPEVVIDGIGGVLVPGEDPEALAKATLDLLADPARLQTLSESAANLARTQHTTKRMTADYLKLYAGAVADQRLRSGRPLVSS